MVNAKFISSKTVVILCDKLSDRVFLLGRLWRLCNVKLILIYREPNLIYKNLSFEDFSCVIKVQSAAEAIQICTRIENSIIHYFSYSPDQIGFLLLTNQIPYIYDYKDLFSNTLYHESAFQNHKLEKAIIARARFITHRDKQIFNFLDKNKLVYNLSQLIYIPEFFCTNDDYEQKLIRSICTNQDTKTVRVVMTGGYPAENSSVVLAEGISKVIQFFIENEIYIDVIGGFSNVHRLNEPYSSSSIKSFLDSNYLKIISSTSSDQFDNQLLNYDFAMHMFNFDLYNPDTSQFINRFEHSAFCGSSRIYSFIKACLPIIIGPSLPYVKSVIEPNSFGIYLDNPDVNLKSFLMNLKLSEYKKNLLMKRNNFGVQNAHECFAISVSKLLS